MNYTYLQLVGLAQAAGFSPADAATAAAIALAESSGNPNALGDAGNSWGLWQIYLPAHPEFAGQNLMDPATNAATAFSVWSAAGGSFSPWSTYKSGAYAMYLQPAAATSAGIATAAPTSQGGGTGVMVLPTAAATPSIDWGTVGLFAGLAIAAGLVLDSL